MTDATCTCHCFPPSLRAGPSNMRLFRRQEESQKGEERYKKGKYGEELALHVLEERGFHLREKNVISRTGEIDIVAERHGELHFFEVKLRGEGSWTPAREALTPQQQGRIRREAELYLLRHEKEWGHSLPPCFFGMIAIEFHHGIPSVECIENAF